MSVFGREFSKTLMSFSEGRAVPRGKIRPLSFKDFDKQWDSSEVVDFWAHFTWEKENKVRKRIYPALSRPTTN